MGQNDGSRTPEPVFEELRFQDILRPRAQVALIEISDKYRGMSEPLDVTEAIDSRSETISEHQLKRFTSQDDDEIERQLKDALEFVGPIEISGLFSGDEFSAIPPQAQEILRWLEEKPDDIRFQDETVDALGDNILLEDEECLESFFDDSSADKDINQELLQTAYRDAIDVFQSVLEKEMDEEKPPTKILILVFLAVIAANVHLPSITTSIITALAAVNEVTTLRITSP